MKMLTRILRSTLASAILFCLSLVALFLLKEGSEPEHSFTGMQLGILAVIAVVCAAWLVLIGIHNRANPKDRIPVLNFIPAEFREADEGHQWVTYRACRNVYIYYSICLPAAAGASIFIPDLFSKAWAIFGVLILGQYVVYWRTMRRLNRA